MSSQTIHFTQTIDMEKIKAQVAKLKEQVKTICDERDSLRAENQILRQQVARFHPSHSIRVDGDFDDNGL